MAAGVYLHIPFCKSRCSYCDFATDVYKGGDAVERYVDALCHEIAAASRTQESTTSSGTTPPQTRRGALPVDTIYLGGGTPSLLSVEQTGKILNVVRSKFDVETSAEITMEMNPATVTPETLAGYREFGVDRASFGVQTFDDTALRLLARGHDSKDARETFRLLREAGFDNISFDLIAGLPGQKLADWERNLDEAISLAPEHLSLYLLEIHEGTPLAEQVRSKRQPMPDEDVAARMYEVMIERLDAAGYRQYEISNFSRPGFESRHNSKYWRLDPVYGFGVSAHTFDGQPRYSHDRDPSTYVSLIENGGSAEVYREKIDQASEAVFLGLRLNAGIELANYGERFGIPLQSRFGEDLRRLEDLDLIEISRGNLRLTSKGMLFSNEVFSVFV
jgi:oxygen-independent coproporphyrinogen-3 oxidase